jgi:prepilin-type N-terminal cleavage/methylation domain-containing protein
MRQRGLTLVELLIVMAIVGMFTAIAMPNWIALHRRSALRAAALEFTSLFRAARMRAIVSGRSSGVKFTKAADGTWMYTVYEDGNGDGVRNADITSGADRRIAIAKRVLDTVRFVSVGVPSKRIVDPDGDPLRPTDSPVQFGTSYICSFSPLGASTSGTIYLTDSDGGAWCVRVYGASAKVRMLRWTGKKWVAA